jgi:phosphonate transport system substrate-binding protein
MRIQRYLVYGLSLLVLACSPEAQQQAPQALRIGILPDERADALRDRYTPLLAYLSEQLKIEIEMKIPTDYTELVKLFQDGDIDIAYLGGATFVHSHQEYGVVPLVMRDVDVNFTTYFLAKAEATEVNIPDFNQKSFSFGSTLSTSGHLMPRYFLGEMGINPETFFRTVQYSGRHDRTATWVQDGIVDLGAVNSEIVEEMFRDGRLEPDSVRIVWETPPYADYVWASRSELGVDLTRRLRDAFLGLSPADERHVEILWRIGARGFFPASASDFYRLRDVMHEFPMF